MALRTSLGTLPARERQILEARLGLSGRVLTLEEIGQSLGLTRERVRQLESAAVAKIKAEAAWPAVLDQKLKHALKGRTEPLWLILLSTVDSFFEDYEFSDLVVSRVIETFADPKFHCFEVERLRVCSTAAPEQFENQCREFQVYAKAIVPQRPTRFVLELYAESLMANCSARDLYKPVYRSAESYLQYAQLTGSAEPVLIAFGRGAEYVALAVLEESDQPLHFKEVHERVVARHSSEVDIRRVRAALKQKGVFLFGRGMYGLRRHLKVTEREIAEVKDLAEEIVLSEGSGRQWHAHEILDQLALDTDRRGAQITPYALDIILDGSERLRSLGRMVWVAASSAHKDSGDRIEIAQACMSLLREAGHALSRQEMVKLLKNWRGVSKSFQLQRRPEFIALAPGVWGLRERDLPLKEGEVATLLDALFGELIERSATLHQSELIAVFRKSKVPFIGRVDPYWMLSLAGCDSRFRVFYGGYIGLATWDRSKRLPPAAARTLPIDFPDYGAEND